MREGARRDLDARRASFLSRAEDYERARPSYPIDAITWVVGRRPQRVIDVGCGPGNLTSQLRELGHTAIGIDPSMAMLQVMIGKRMIGVCGLAEALPLRDGCADVVTAATAFHWFTHDRAVPEMRRVLRDDGRVGLFTNFRDESVSWVQALSDIIGSEAAMAVTLGGADGMEAEFVARLEGGGLFESTEHRVFNLEQELTAERLVGLVRSRSYVAILPEKEQNRLLTEVQRLCTEHPALRDQVSFMMPYKTHVFRSTAS